MRYKGVIIIAVLLSLGGLLFGRVLHAPTEQELGAFLESIESKLPKQQNYATPLERTNAALGATPESRLTATGVLELTNKERAAQGLQPLKENSKLRKAAAAKLADMLKQQYFEHVSPDGKAPADVVSAAGYEYVIVGENLAEGDFANNADLVTGWMNSKGHRENILHPKYTEIGIAVEKGLYKNRMVWMAVQEFGKPLSDCPSPDESLRSQISTNESQIRIAQAELENLTAHMAELKAAGDSEGYNALVSEYNSQAARINAKIGETKGFINLYNAGVKQFNACVE